MKISKKEIVLQCLERIEILHKLQSNFLETCAELQKRRAGYSNIVERGNVYQLLVEEELHEWRNLLMWGITLNAEDQTRIKAAVYNQFLKPGMSVMQWLNNGILPSKWLTSDEQEFREMIKQTFLPKDE